MKSFRQQFVTYSQIIYRVFIFLAAAVLLHLVLPGEPRFKFEYQKGAPWKHENLVAPFDFAILKSPAELEQEKQEAARNFAPYFTTDTTMVRQKIRELTADFNAAIDADYSRKAEILPKLTGTLDSVYHAGILPASPESMEILTGRTQISRVWGNLVDIVPVNRLYSEKTAYNRFVAKLAEVKAGYPRVARQLAQLDARKYIHSNLKFDENISKSELKRIEAGISTARGMMQAGERIILEGELVDDAKFQLLESLKNTYEKKRVEGINSHLVSIGKFALVAVFLTLLYTFLYTYKRNILVNSRRITFLLLFIVFMVFIAQLVSSYEGLHIYMFPLAILPVVVRTFFDSRTAIFTLIITSLLLGFYAPNNYEYVLLEVSAGMIAVFSLNKMHRRMHVVLASMLVALTYGVVYTAITLIQNGSLIDYEYKTLQWFAWSSLLILMVYPLIYIFEKLFGFVSDVTLIELSNTNQPLLRKLADEAPGTFQHSMQIANLAEEVIRKIGGNPFLVRAGALYHDIGKISQPTFFIENQQAGMNPHDQMSYIKSAEIIIDHVRNGLKMAKKYRLPESIVEFIATHHGTTKAKYFYLKQQQENPQEVVNEENFAYPGPLPHSREAAVVMLIDGI
ncbi:MAG TPA: HDIG domain-containing protein, partial [Prolixibacteraceae bacterium]|nr:HDIG domain-containing protein [Prolixibacteraceae bacterium]